MQANSKNQTDPAKYKTEMCRNWQLYNECQYGKKCQFAHGYNELHVKSNINAFYKTRQCNLFHEQGFCRYGQRCHFIHEDRTLEQVKAQS